MLGAVAIHGKIRRGIEIQWNLDCFFLWIGRRYCKIMIVASFGVFLHVETNAVLLEQLLWAQKLTWTVGDVERVIDRHFNVVG